MAYFSFKYQESIQIEKDKMNAANKWTLLAEQARSNLFSIKMNYIEVLTDNPVKRAMVIPNIIMNSEYVDQRYEDLSFIVPKIEAQGSKPPKWSQIPRVRVMFGNYNFLQTIWEKRNTHVQFFKEELMKKHSGKSYVDISLKELKSFNPAKLSRLVDLTERAVMLTDDILIELDDFLSEFPKYVKTKINIKRLKKYGSILEYSSEGNDKIEPLLKRVCEADPQLLSKMFGKTVDEIKKRYEVGYEKVN